MSDWSTTDDDELAAFDDMQSELRGAHQELWDVSADERDSEEEERAADDAWIDPQAIWRTNVAALAGLPDGHGLQYYFAGKTDRTTLLVLVVPENAYLDGSLDITLGNEHGVGTMTRSGNVLYTNYERHLTHELFIGLAAECGLQVAAEGADAPTPLGVGGTRDDEVAPQGIGRILDENSVDQQAIQSVNIAALSALEDGEEVRYYFAGKEDRTTLLVLIVPDNDWLEGGLDVTNGDEYGIGTLSKRDGVLTTTMERHQGHPLFIQLATACGLRVAGSDATPPDANEPDPDAMRTANLQALQSLQEGDSIEYFVGTFSDGQAMLVVGRDHGAATWQRFEDAPYERGELQLLASPSTGEVTLYAVDAPTAARAPLQDLANDVPFAGGLAFDAPSAAGAGRTNSIDVAAVRQGNIGAVRALGDREGVEYWIGVDDAGDVMLVVGRDHDPLVYQALQARRVENGYLQYRLGSGDGELVAHNAPDAAEDALRELANHTSGGIIYFSEQDQPFLVEVDLAALEARNKASIKATPDGGSVRFEMFEQEGSKILAIGDDHPEQFQMLTSLGSGRIMVKKARRLQRGAGTLNVIGARDEDQNLIEGILSDFSDKKVVFDEEE